MKIAMLIVMFFIIGALFIISENKIDMREEAGQGKFISIYISWLGQIFDNTKATIGYVVKMDWLPDNISG